jgi:hypothetical protein
VKQPGNSHTIHFYTLILLLTLFVGRSDAQDFMSAGARGGVSFNGNKDRFRQAEAFTDFDLPWRWNFYSDWQLKPRIDISGGWLNGENKSAVPVTYRAISSKRDKAALGDGMKQ